MPTPTRTKSVSACCEAIAGCGSMRASKKDTGRNGVAVARLLRKESGHEEACDKRSMPQDVTSSWTRREGINLQQEVEPHLTERSPRNSPRKDTTDKKSAAEMNIQPDRGRHIGFWGVH